MKLLDVSEELVLIRFGNGIKLVSPETADRLKPTFSSCNTGYTVKDIIGLPFNIGFSNTDVCIQRLNEQAVTTLGFESPRMAQGQRISSVVDKKGAQRVIDHNFQTINSNKITIAEEEVIRKDEVSLNRISFYIPWYNLENKIIGVYGCTIIVGMQSLANSLSHIKDMGILNSSHLPVPQLANFSRENISSLQFTNRERDCIYLIVRGKTIKETARILGLSMRTVESYFDHIKVKMNVSTKSEFISKILDGFDVIN